MTISNPKLTAQETRHNGGWYRYYAGFSHAFVEDAIKSLNLIEDSVVYDPWIGSGTTAAVAARHALNASGCDLNPALVVIAGGRGLARDFADTFIQAVRQSIELSRRDSHWADVDHDPLGIWFDNNSIRKIRNLESSICTVLQKTPIRLNNLGKINTWDEKLHCALYVLLFRMVRAFLKTFKSSNPTWIRRPRELSDRVAPTNLEIEEVFSEIAKAIQLQISGHSPLTKPRPTEFFSVSVGNSTHLPVKDETIAGVITSPPYCTRIDYVIKTLPELCVLRADSDDVERLRASMIGTPITSNVNCESNDHWGGECIKTLRRIKSHKSKASETYYHRYFLNYFDKLFTSMLEVSRILISGGGAIIVVQESSYKDILIKLPKIVNEMAKSSKLHTKRMDSFPVTTNMSRVHKWSGRYGRGANVKECVLFMEKRG